MKLKDMADLGIQEQIKLLRKTIDQVRYECKSRSGMIDLDYTGGDNSDFDVIFLAALIEDAKNSLGNIFCEEFKNEIVNRFMILHHELIVKNKHFNWNWD